MASRSPDRRAKTPSKPRRSTTPERPGDGGSTSSARRSTTPARDAASEPPARRRGFGKLFCGGTLTATKAAGPKFGGVLGEYEDDEAEYASSPHEELRRELAALKPTALRRRARAAGVADEDIEVAEDDDDDPKVAVIELIVAVAQKPDDAPVDSTKDGGPLAALSFEMAHVPAVVALPGLLPVAAFAAAGAVPLLSLLPFPLSLSFD